MYHTSLPAASLASSAYLALRGVPIGRVHAFETIERRLPKSFVMAATDYDVSQANATVAKLSQLHELDPGLLIVPAHDRSAWKQAFGPAPGCVP